MSTKLPDPENSLGFALHHASFVFKAAMKDQFRALGINLTPEEFVFLACVPMSGALQSELAVKSLKDKAATTRLIDKLVTKELVTREENSSDRREQIITKTKSGSQLLAKAIKAAGVVTEKALAGVPVDQVEPARALLLSITQNLQK